MYTYRRRARIDAGSIFFIVIFLMASAVIGYFAFTDKGKFWDILPFICIPVIIISLILVIVNFARRTKAGTFFVLFFLLSVVGLIMSSFFGPLALINDAEKSFDNKNYEDSINYYKTVLDNYPGSRHANTALKNISFAYFSNKNYMEAINSFNKAIELEIISNNDLEIKKVLEECYIRSAERYYKNNKYASSAENYFEAVIILEDIKNNFPDTNEAFIAEYKIPEYLYRAASDFNKVKNWDRSIECLEKIIREYNDSDYFSNACHLLLDTYIKKSRELILDNNYQKGVEEFLKVLDLDTTGYIYNNISDYQKQMIFSNIPPDILKKIAKDNYNSGSYKKSLFLCEIIIGYNTEIEEDIAPLLVDSKLKLISSSDYKLLEQPAPLRRFWGSKKSILVIENNTEFDLTMYLKGPEYKMIKIEKNSSQEIEITPGIYKTAMDSNNTDILPYYGEIAYEEGQKYLVEYSI
jgi:tetratricopeptide (TPR) repeat protein